MRCLQNLLDQWFNLLGKHTRRKLSKPKEIKMEKLLLLKKFLNSKIKKNFELHDGVFSNEEVIRSDLSSNNL